jgi:hypothetical protein
MAAKQVTFTFEKNTYVINWDKSDLVLRLVTQIVGLQRLGSS